VRSALAFLTPLPIGTPRPDAGTLTWFPAAGAVVGLVVGATWWAGGEVFPALVAAAIAVLADVLVTGALHLDGVADTADGLLAHDADADRRRAIMAAPDVGAFGVAAVAGVLLLRWSAFASMAPDVWLVVALWCASRAVMAIALATLPYVGGGLGAAFAGATPWPGVLGMAAGGAVAAATAGVAGIGAVVALALAAAGVLVAGRARLGGVTGDVLGAAGVVGETAALVVATASW
jgi:adenosylcobinamide-GDP ribazoletransferase